MVTTGLYVSEMTAGTVDANNCVLISLPLCVHHKTINGERFAGVNFADFKSTVKVFL